MTQWQNLIPLVDHVLSERHRTLVVGDGKQAIYRQRNGDYRQLLHLPNIVDDDEEPLPMPSARSTRPSTSNQPIGEADRPLSIGTTGFQCPPGPTAGGRSSGL